MLLGVRDGSLAQSFTTERLFLSLRQQYRGLSTDKSTGLCLVSKRKKEKRRKGKAVPVPVWPKSDKRATHVGLVTGMEMMPKLNSQLWTIVTVALVMRKKTELIKSTNYLMAV